MKKPLQPDYKFYPSLLDAYRWYQQSESDTAEQELIDKINRVPFKSEAADKGTWLNDLIDLSLKGERFGLNYLTGVAADLVYKLRGAARQVYTSTTIEVDGNIVEVYGYIDFVKEDCVIDLKTTANYELGKYKNSLQLHFYPVSLIDDGNDINLFEFLVTDFQSIYREVYRVNYQESKSILQDTCRELIRFLELRKDLITDKKIFNQLQAA
jgi:hypothetical protein